MSVLQEALQEYAASSHSSVDEVSEQLAKSLHAAATRLRLVAVPDVERPLLHEANIPTERLPPGDPWLTGELFARTMTADAVSLRDAAQELGLSPGRLRQMIAERPNGKAELFGVRDSQGHWLVYRYQLVDKGLVARHGRIVQRSLPPGMDPVAAAAWWDTPNPGCYHGRRELSPRQWLAAGLAVDQLVESATFEDAR